MYEDVLLFTCVLNKALCFTHRSERTCITAMQVITEYSDEQLPMVLEATEKLEAHLTAAVVSNDAKFTQKVQCLATPSHMQ